MKRKSQAEENKTDNSIQNPLVNTVERSPRTSQRDNTRKKLLSMI